MTDDLHQEPLAAVAEALAREPDIQVVIVFGSAATGRTDADSDFDIAVLGVEVLDTDRRLSLIRRIGELTGRPVDLVDLRTAGVVTLRSVFRNGRRLVCKDRRAYDRLLSRMLVDTEDFLPYRERMLRQRRNAWTR